VLYVYTITDAATVPGGTGLHGARVRAIRNGSLAALVSEHDELRLTPNEDELWEHESVVEAAMDRGAALPMRIGSVVADEAAVLQLLRERHAAFERALESVRGAVELGIRIVFEAQERQPPEANEVAASGPGTTYMLTRLSRKQQRDELGARVHAPLCELSRAHTSLSSSLGRESMTGAYLVDRRAVDEFRARVEELQGTLEGVTVTCTGPWPPYSFTGEEQA
jgi:Gas vesicle synthesis protein GvpL/GvpF